MADGIIARPRADLSLATIVVDGDRHPATWRSLAALFGPGPLTPATPLGDAPMLVWRSPSELIVIGAPDVIESRMADVAAIVAGVPSLIEPRDCGLVVVELSGPAVDLACPLPFDPVPGASQSATMRIAGLRVTLVRLPAPELRAWLIVDRPSVGYFRQWLARRAEIALEGSARPD